ncbi:hypothetical protein [Neisseria animaloris]|uniref:hypothetical protein n=1 Tax=Neisseria animaloris TaxID=326522 RepID=UPI0019017280|nr:hypothetical protein [Neisseria animaloris]
MTTYQELVSRVLSVKHASLEIGLAKAREQQPFIEQVSRKLDATSWDYVAGMDKDFGVTFHIDRGIVDFKNQYQAIKQALEAQFDVEFTVSAASPALDVSCRRSGCSCRLIFKELP